MTATPPNQTLTLSHKHSEPDPALLEVTLFGATPRARGYTVIDGVQDTLFRFDISPPLVPEVKALAGLALEGRQGVKTLAGWGVSLSSVLRGKRPSPAGHHLRGAAGGLAAAGGRAPQRHRLPPGRHPDRDQ